MRGRTLRLSMSVLGAALAAAMAVTLMGCTASGDAGTEQGAESEPIRVGVIVSLTGTYAGLGTPEKQAIEMEVARINDAGGINGRPLEVLFEDDATDEAKAVAAASKLIEQQRVVAIIGATGTGQSMAVRNEIQRAGVPQISMAGGTIITKQFDPLVFQTPWSNTLVAPYTLEYMKSEGITRIGLISDSGGFGKDGREVVIEEAEKAGIEIVADESFNPGDSDMTAQLTRLRGSGAQAVLVWTAGKEAAIIAKNARDLGIDLPLIGSHGNARKEFIEGAGDAAEDFTFVAGKILVPEAYGEDTEAYRVATEFADRFRESFGVEPNTFAGHAYDALYLIAEAAKRVDGDVTPDALRDAIEATDGFVGIGGTFTFSDTDHNGLSADDLSVYRINGGEWTLVR